MKNLKKILKGILLTILSIIALLVISFFVLKKTNFSPHRSEEGEDLDMAFQTRSIISNPRRK